MATIVSAVTILEGRNAYKFPRLGQEGLISRKIRQLGAPLWRYTPPAVGEPTLFIRPRGIFSHLSEAV